MYENMSDNDNASLFIVTISADDKTSKIEKISGLFLWESLVGTKVTRDKNKIRKIWKYE